MMSSDLEISLSPPLPASIPSPPSPISSEIDSFLEISLHGGKDGLHGSSISRAHCLHNRENFLSHLLGQHTGPRILVLFGSFAHPSTNCCVQRGGVLQLVSWSACAFLDKPIRVMLCEEKASSNGRTMMPPKNCPS